MKLRLAMLIILALLALTTNLTSAVRDTGLPFGVSLTEVEIPS